MRLRVRRLAHLERGGVPQQEVTKREDDGAGAGGRLTLEHRRPVPGKRSGSRYYHNNNYYYHHCHNNYYYQLCSSSSSSSK